MGYYYFQCRSVTYAQRASKYLNSHSVYVGIVKLPLNISLEGCGYSIRVPERHWGKASKLLKDVGFEFKNIYFSKNEKDFREVLM